MSERSQTMKKKRTAARMAKVIDEAVLMAYIIKPGEQPTQQMLAAKAGRLGVVVPEFGAWVTEASNLRGKGYARDQTLKALPVVTGGEVQWQGKKPEEAKMVAKKTTKSGATKKTTKKSSKSKAAKKKAAKKSKATGRGKAVVVYFNASNLKVLAAAKKFAKKNEQSLASVVTEALDTLLKL